MTGIIIQARSTSTRLPGKINLPLWRNFDVLSFLLARLKKAGWQLVCLAIPRGDNVSASDDMAYVYHGSEDDVLGRYYDAAKRFGFLNVMRITSDCPLVDPSAVSAMANQFAQGGVDYLSNCHPIRTMPKGFDVEIFSYEALTHAHFTTAWPYHREHVTPYFYGAVDRLDEHEARASDVAPVRCDTYTPEDGADAGNDLPNLSIDTEADYKRVKAIITKLDRLDFTWREAVEIARSL